MLYLYFNSVTFHFINVQGSWKTKLRDRFKFLRRPARSLQPESTEPPAKRPRNTESYETNVELMQVEMRKRKKDRRVATVETLMEETFSERRSWIQTSQPVVSDILEKFPSLKVRKVVSSVVKNSLHAMWD